MRNGRRVDELHRLCRHDVLTFTAEKGNGVAVSPVALVAVDGHLQLLRIREFHSLTLVGIKVLDISAGESSSVLIRGPREGREGRSGEWGLLC